MKYISDIEKDRRLVLSAFDSVSCPVAACSDRGAILYYNEFYRRIFLDQLGLGSQLGLRRNLFKKMKPTAEPKGEFHGKIDILPAEWQNFEAKVLSGEDIYIITFIKSAITADESISSENDNYPGLIEQLPVGVYRSTPEGRILLINQYIRDMLELDPDWDPAGIDLNRVDYGPDYRRDEFIAELIERRDVVRIESVWKSRLGKEINVIESARPIMNAGGGIMYIEGVIENISSRKKSEKALIESEEKFRKIFEHAHDSYLLLDLNGKIIDCNRGAADFFGMPAEAITGNTLEEFSAIIGIEYSIIMTEPEISAERIASGINCNYDNPVIIRFATPNDRLKIARSRTYRFHSNGEELICNMITDVTESERTRELLITQRRISQMPVVGHNPEDALDSALCHIMDIPEIDYAAFCAKDNENGSRYVRAWRKSDGKVFHDRDASPFNCEKGFAIRNSYFGPASELISFSDAIGSHVYNYGGIIDCGNTALGRGYLLVLSKTGKAFPQFLKNALYSIVGSTSNVINKIKYLRELRNREAEKNMILDSISEVVIYQDMEHNILWANRAFYEKLDISRTNDKLKCFHTLFDENESCNQCPASKVLVTMRPAKSQIRTKNGLWWDITVNPVFNEEREVIAFVELALDVTADVKYSQYLQESRHRLRLTLEAAADAIWDWSLKGNEIYLSPSFYSFTGYTTAEKPSDFNDWIRLIHPADRRKLIEEMKRILRSERDNFRVQYRLKSKFGDYDWYETLGKVISRDRSGRPANMMGTMIDISEQKDAEERMIAQREFLRNIIDIIPSFIYVKDEYGRYLIVNQKVEEAFNSENKYIIGRKDRDFLDPEFGERFRRQDEEVLRTDRELFIPEEYFVGANNRGYWLQTYKKPITDYTNGKKAVLGVALDNTDRKKAAQELESSERMLKAILKASPIGIALVRNLEVIWTNEAMYSIIGYPVGSFTGKTPHGLFPKADVFENLTQTVREHIEAQGYAQIETELVRADSQKFDALIMIRRIHQDKPEVGNIVAMMDISERKRAEKTYRALVEHSLQGMMILSIMRDYQVLFVNEALCGITSYTSDEMLEFGYDDINDLIFSEDRDEFWKHVNNQIYGIAAPEVFECRIITKYSEVRWVESFILKSRFDREESIQLSFMDISDRKRNEQHKKFALAALVEAEKRKHQTSVLLDNSARIASIGVIAGGITHEINQPLNAIKMGADSIIFWDDNNGKPLPQMVRTLVGHISLATKRIENIITHMRSFWIDKEKLSREPINLNRAVDSAVSLVRQRIHAREIIFNIELHPESLNISANQVQLELIINNLVLNSYHALALVEDRRKKINLRTFRDNSHAVFEVEDNGVGLPDVPPEKLFDPFFSTRKFFEGTGLGLAIVKMFCDRFDAGIKVIPKKQGAIFQVIFDILEEPAENE